MQRSGDISNRVKAVEDALTGVAYLDDKQVYRLVVEWSECGASEPYVVATVTPWRKILDPTKA
jgi:Holliday junction resolvase RusA-like endonuclease